MVKSVYVEEEEHKRPFVYVLLVFLLVSLIISMFLLYELLPQGTETFNRYELSKNFSSFNESKHGQFYSDMRFSDSLISYHIDSDCSDIRYNDMIGAFNFLENQTIVRFYEISLNSQIAVHCSNSAKIEGKMIIAGEGGPNYVVQTDHYNIIINGSILLLRDSNCPRPNIAIHELLHVFGFDHSNVSSSILYPTSRCEQQLSQDIIDTIDNLYSVESLPDLYFSEAYANKSGRYLNLDVEIKNSGLRDAKPFDMYVYADAEFVEKFSFENIGVGEGRILRVNNLKMPISNVKKIIFFIDEKNNTKEIDKSNNKVTLNIEVSS